MSGRSRNHASAKTACFRRVRARDPSRVPSSRLCSASWPDTNTASWNGTSRESYDSTRSLRTGEGSWSKPLVPGAPRLPGISCYVRVSAQMGVMPRMTALPLLRKPHYVNHILRGQMISDVLIGVITNVITIILGTIVSLLLLAFRRKRLLRFYGVRRSRSELRIVISRLDVKPGGTTAAIPITNGYVGPAVTQPEYDAAVLLQEQIRPQIFAWFSRETRDWIAGKLVHVALINPLIKLHDPTQVSTWVQNYSRSNLILIGGPVYNAASGFYQVSEGAHYTLLRGPAGVGWRVQSRRGITPGRSGLTESRAVRRELAFIQRIIRTDTRACITTLVGTGAAAKIATQLSAT